MTDDETQTDLEYDTALAVPKPKRAAKPKQGAGVDVFGFQLGTLRAQAAALYARKGGATLHEVTAALGSAQYNLLAAARNRGHRVREKREDGDGTKSRIRFFLTPQT